MNFDINKIRSEFPMLQQSVYNKPLIYFDNGATTQKPACVLDAMRDFYETKNSNIHRGVHRFSQVATECYENARVTVQKFINAEYSHEIIFTRGTTESINLVAFSFGESFVNEGDEIIVSEMEHHSNIVPWQLLCERKKATVKMLPFDDNGELKISELSHLITKKTKLITVNYISNSLGTVNPIKLIIEKAHANNIPVLIDAAQAIQHVSLNVQELNCDFLAFSGHKIYAPNGIGVLYGKEQWLKQMTPYQGGGDMIKNVSFAGTTFADLPFKFEAGTSNYPATVGLAAAIKYVENIGIKNIAEYEQELLKYATGKLQEINGLKIYGTAKEKTCVISFLLKGIHFYDTGMIFDKMGIAVRTGTHCTEPVMQHFDIDGTVRASFAFYNTFEEIDYFVDAVKKVKMMFE